jgi:toxin ParE1/3/4
VRVAWAESALAQLEQLVEYIGREDLAAAYAIRDRIVERVEQLRSFPELGPTGKRGTRQLVIVGTSYVASYRVRSDVVHIVAVWHSAQRR